MYSVAFLILCLSFPVIVRSDYNCTTPNTLITFDDLPEVSDTASIPNNYFDLVWSNVAYMFIPYFNSQNGDHTALSSELYVAYNNYGNPMTISSPAASYAFNINSFITVALFRNNLTLSMHGKRDGVTIHQQTVILQTNVSSFIVLNWTYIDTISFTTSGGIVNPMFSAQENDTTFAIDNLCVDIQQPSKNTIFLFRSSFYTPTLYPITTTPWIIIITSDSDTDEYRLKTRQQLIEPLENQAVTICPDLWSDKFRQISYLDQRTHFVTAPKPYSTTKCAAHQFNNVDKSSCYQTIRKKRKNNKIIPLQILEIISFSDFENGAENSEHNQIKNDENSGKKNQLVRDNKDVECS
ncbi:unnamed protein product [Adineta steineri]|uniref:Uncharacterized protein n=1 Tax=Adineta steineri TaxID=433720 RepID=A0A815LJY6_9BILA|nr:unnamed protein product [Adineta steineri]CAF1616526.1 unnamed protein product [Adineta steineri]